MRRVVTWGLLILILGAFAYIIATTIFIGCIFGQYDHQYSKKELESQFDQNEKEITELVSYINEIVPVGKTVSIEFGKGESIAIFQVTVNQFRDDNWDVELNSSKTDTLLSEIGWTKRELQILKEKLEKANCIGIESGDPVIIGFQRSGMGEYFFNVFSASLSDSLLNKYNDSCSYLYYKKNIVFQYGGGAAGPQCFPNSR